MATANTSTATSNTYWDWNLNHVGSAYGMMDQVFKFAATFKEFPPRSFPPSFNPATVLEQTLHNIKAVRALHELKEERVFAAAAGASGAAGGGPAKK